MAAAREVAKPRPPSAKEYTVFSIDLLSTDDVPADDISLFRSKAQEMIDSLIIM